MTNFVRFNGWDVPIIDASEDHEVIGEPPTRAFDGSILTDRRYIKRQWALRTKHVSEMVAEAIKGVALGHGHNWNFDSDAYSYKGLAPSGQYERRLAAAAMSGNNQVVDENNKSESKYGNASLAVEQGVTNILSNDTADCENGTTGWSAVDSASITSEASIFYEQTKSIKVVTSATVNAVRGGIQTSTAGITGGQTYVGSVYIYTVTGATIRVYLEDSAANQSAVKTVTLQNSKWNRITTNSLVTGGGATTIKLVVLEDVADANITYYVDAAQVELGTIATSWRDPASGARAAGSLTYPVSAVTGATDLTVAFWAKLGTANQSSDRYFINMAVSGTDTFTLRRAASTNDLRFAAGATVTYSTNPWNGDWHHVAAVLRQNTETGENRMELYFDGASVGTGAGTAIDFSTITALRVGHRNSSLFLNDGLMDELVIVPYAAPAALVSAWYSLGKAMPGIPDFYMDGDMMPDTLLTAKAQASEISSEYIRAKDGSNWRENMRRISMRLMEV